VCELSERVGDQSVRLRGLLNVAAARFSRGEISRSLEISRSCRKLAEQDSSPEMLLPVQLLLATGLRCSADLVQASLLGHYLCRYP
jgi:hypothetical protein